MSTYQPKTYRKQGGAEFVIASGGAINVESGGAIKADGTQAAAISDLAAITGGESPTEAEHNAARTAINGILAALRGAGIIAAS